MVASVEVALVASLWRISSLSLEISLVVTSVVLAVAHAVARGLAVALISE